MSDSKSDFNCKKCREKDTEDMVQCDKCDKWYHFDCVGVNSKVAEESWSCEGCFSPPMSIGNSSTTDNLSKQPLLPPQAASSPASGYPPSTNGLPSDGLALSSAGVAMATIQQPSIVPRPLYCSVPFPGQTQVSVATNFYSNIAPPQSIPPVYMMPQCSTIYPSSTYTYAHEAQRQHINYSEHLRFSTANQFTAAPRNIQVSMPSETLPSATGPSAAQIAARYAIPKELPQFNGDPEAWPVFISSFENSTAVAGFSDAENLIRLQSCLKGRAREMVKSRLMLPAMVPEIINTLRMCFGRPEHILERVVEKARQFPPPKDKLEALIDYALCVKNICATMETCHLEAHLNNPMLVKELVDKLSSQYKLSWAMHLKDDRIPVVKIFSDWIYNIANAASQVTSPASTYKSASINTHTTEQSSPVKLTCIICSNSGHKVAQCNTFKKFSLEQKWQAVKTNKLCRLCLNVHRRKCYINKECGIENCKAKHHQLLHRHNDNLQHTPCHNQNVSTVQNAHGERSEVINSHSHSQEEERPYFRIVPIRIHSNDKFVDTFAFLDEGSSVTLMDADIYETLGLKGIEDPLCLKWTGDTTRQENDSMRTTIHVSNIQNGNKFILEGVHTVKNLGLPTQTLKMDEMTTKYPYLAGIPMQSYTNAKPSLLIGADNWKLAVPLKIREGSRQQPIASKARIGWAIQGSGSSNEAAYMNMHTCECSKRYEELHEMVKQSFNFESSTTKSLISADDKKALDILTSTCTHRNGRFEVGLLWRNIPVELPDSYSVAYRRLMCLHKKFSKDQSLRVTLQQQVDNLLSKGYARKLSEEEIKRHNGPVWYLPVFITYNINKPGKVRLVWDAAAKSNGTSLNDFMLTGPDLLNSLVDILINFRIGRVAICGDIAEMFHQIDVKESDMHVQRFLWWDKEDEVYQPSVYVMRALTFGTRCAPCIAHYVRDKNAEQFHQQYPRAVKAIREFHYVDDFIDSVDSEQSAIELAQQVKHIHKNAGFNIRNWASNSTAVLFQLDESKTLKQAPLALGSTEKILGMYWDSNDDTFRYIFRFSRLRRDVFVEHTKPTKRETLQVLMSIYDPLGFLSCYTTGLKILLQDVWREGIGWDDELSGQLYLKWCQWKAVVPLIAKVKIPRCYSTDLMDASDIQLHTFVDAGESAYAAISYLRVQCQNNVTITIVAAKSKVSPLKSFSIPRLELQAAVLGVRLATSIISVRRLPISSSYYWTDSKTSIQRFRMDPRKFQQFEMNRIGEILESTNVTQWKWVPTKMNPADLATKIRQNWQAGMWFTGPEFLKEDVDCWPVPDKIGPINDSALRQHLLMIDRAAIAHCSINFEYFSDWGRLYRALANFLLYLHKLKANLKLLPPPQAISFEMIQKAKRILIQQAQMSEYRKEFLYLKNGKILENNSKLISLNVYIDPEQVIRARGRAEFLNNEDVIVLPHEHHVTFLLVRFYHENFHHVSHETTINKIRSRYYIPRLRVLYKKIRRLCQRCKNNLARPLQPQMAPLPQARLASFERPFTYVGIDYFGPLYVAVGRRREKRWGVIFTCLTVRAIHIEVAHSLNTTSCIMAIRNFTSRRGTPREIYTDNGTNFKATEKILREECKDISYSHIFSQYEDIKWKFNPPATPHMGGAWERLVRSIKTILYAMIPSMNFSEESLQSAMCEIEFIINSRPLTFVSLEACDDEAITPNHLLLGSSGGYKPICNETTDLRLRWQQTQAFINRFWQRWVKEYAPTLTRRSKWFNKQRPLAVGDVVVIIDETLPRNSWPRGVITAIVTAKDGQVRRATVKTPNSVFERPAAKIAILDVNKDGK